MAQCIECTNTAPHYNVRCAIHQDKEAQRDELRRMIQLLELSTGEHRVDAVVEVVLHLLHNQLDSI